jgi:hypothetical protein
MLLDQLPVFVFAKLLVAVLWLVAVRLEFIIVFKYFNAVFVSF